MPCPFLNPPHSGLSDLVSQSLAGELGGARTPQFISRRDCSCAMMDLLRRSMKIFILISLLLLPLAALAEYIDPYGNAVFPNESYARFPGAAAYRDTNGRIHYENVPTPITRESHSIQTPDPQPVPRSEYR